MTLHDDGLTRVYRFAQSCALTEHSRGRGYEERQWLDVLALLDLARHPEPAVSDEHHTMDELYEYRMLYNAHAAHGWVSAGVPVVKSWLHSDGELCFGGGWFIVVAALPSGQVSNHYAAEHWDLFDVPEVNRPPEYDGHTPEVAAKRLRDGLMALAQLQPQVPVGEGLENGVSDGEREALRERVMRDLGTASVCWDEDGVFMSEYVAALGDALVEYIAAGYRKPTLPSVEDVARVMAHTDGGSPGMLFDEGHENTVALYTRHATAVLALIPTVSVEGGAE